jgi:hypothetical protein
MVKILLFLFLQFESFVRKCLDGFVPNNFSSYFKINSHGMGTRNASCLILLPKIHTEYARNYFYYMGAKTYNDLPTDIRKVSNFNSFVNVVKGYLSQIFNVIIYSNIV